MADRWAEWLRTRRDGGSLEQRRLALEFLSPIRDRILDQAAVKPGDVVLDVGCGDGLVGLGALDRGARVIFSDVSEACLEDCRAIAGERTDPRGAGRRRIVGLLHGAARAARVRDRRTLGGRERRAGRR